MGMVNSNLKRGDATKENLSKINLKAKESMNLAMDKYIKEISTKV